MKRFQFRASYLIPLLAMMAACGGKGCSCLSPIPGGFPTDSRRHENAIQVRVTGPALDYLGKNGKALVDALLPMGSTFNIPPSCAGKNTVCCGNPQPMCAIDIGVHTVKLAPAPPNILQFTLTTTLTSKAPIPVAFDVLLGTAKCLFSIDTTKSTTMFKNIDISSDVTFAVDPMTDLTNINLAGTMISHLDASMIDLKSQPGDFFCGIANFGPIKGFVIQQLQKTLADQISSAADGNFCATCMTAADCDGFADGCTGGKCQRKGKCLQEIGAAGRINIAALSSLFAGTGAKMDILAVLGGYAEVGKLPASGISLGMLGGAQGAAHNPCVPMRPSPTQPMVAKWSQFMSNVEPGSSKQYHVGIGVHDSQLNQMAWAAFDGGALCLDVGTAQVAMLDSKTLGIVLPSMADLTHGADVPMFLAVRPNQEPHITLGAGTFDTDGMGKKTIHDPLLHIAMPKLSIDFYALIEERYVRLMTLNADVQLGMALDVDDMGRIVPMLGDLNGAFTNVTVSNSELLREPPAMLAKTFPMLLGLAGGALGKLAPIALPKVMGLNLSLVAIEPTDQMSTMSIFANLALATMDAFHAETEASVMEVQAPPTEAFGVVGGLNPSMQPRVVLALGGAGYGGDSSDLEWQVKIDDGLWGIWSGERTQVVSDPRLWLQGRHHASVRSRVLGEAVTTDATPVELDFIVDTIAPVGTFDVLGDEIVFVGRDGVSPVEALQYSYRLPGPGGVEAWSAWSANARVKVVGAATAMLDPFAMAGRIRDEAGNIGEADFHGRMTAPAAAGGCGCHITGRPHGHPERGMLIALLAVGAMLLGMRRRPLLLQRSKGYLPLCAVGLLLLMAVAGCQESSQAVMLQPGDLVNPMDEVGRYSDAAAQAGTIKISAYDDTYGDLAYAEVKVGDTGKPIEWQWVDGLPADAAAMAIGMSYRHGSMDPGDDVGLYSSLALMPSGDPRIAYHDATNGALKFASGSLRKFTSQVVDAPGAGGGRAGLYASLSLDGSGVPSIAYVTTGIPNGKGGFSSKLRIATAKTAAPAGPSDWILNDVDQSGIPCANLCGKGQACVMADKTDKTKSVCKSVDPMCPAACAATEACVGGACVAILLPSKVQDIAEGIGLFAQLRRLPMGQRLIVYYDREKGNLKLALESAPGMWTLSVVDGNDPTMDIGQFVSAQAAPDGTIHIAYEDAIGDRLLYKTVKGGMAMQMPEVIDDGMRMNGPSPIGGPAIFADGTMVRVVYQEQRLVDLWSASRVNNAWTKQALKTGAPGYGFYPHVVSDGGKLYVTQFAYDRAAENAMPVMAIGSLTIVPLP